jgi:repressor of nif and glnA expression
MAGFFIDKKEVTHVGLEGMSREQLESRLSELEEKIGEAKISLTLRQKKLVNEGNFMTVFNEIHNSHLNSSVGIVSILIEDKK